MSQANFKLEGAETRTKVRTLQANGSGSARHLEIDDDIVLSW